MIECLAGLDPIGLADLDAGAELQDRHDAKFLVPVDQVTALVSHLGGRMRILEVDRERLVDYRTAYFDTADLVTFQAHRQLRRRRYKVRTRQYGTGGSVMLELKLKGARGRTVKHRWPHPDGEPDRLGAEAHSLLARALADEYGWQAPEALTLSLWTMFRRATLVDPVARERMTVDVGLSVASPCAEVAFDPNTAVVECKTSHLHGPLLTQMIAAGHRPAVISKYCVGLVATGSAGPGNPWLPALRGLSGVQG